MSSDRKPPVEPVHAREVLAQLVSAGEGVTLAASLFVGAEHKAATWLMQRGWAKRSRASTGEMMLEATAEGRAEHAKTRKPGELEADPWLGDPTGRTARAMQREAKRAERVGLVQRTCRCGHEPHEGACPRPGCGCARTLDTARVAVRGPRAVAVVEDPRLAPLCDDPTHKSGDCPKMHDSCPICGKAFRVHYGSRRGAPRAPCPNGEAWFAAMYRRSAPKVTPVGDARACSPSTAEPEFARGVLAELVEQGPKDLESCFTGSRRTAALWLVLQGYAFRSAHRNDGHDVSATARGRAQYAKWFPGEARDAGACPRCGAKVFDGIRLTACGECGWKRGEPEAPALARLLQRFEVGDCVRATLAIFDASSGRDVAEGTRGTVRATNVGGCAPLVSVEWEGQEGQEDNPMTTSAENLERLDAATSIFGKVPIAGDPPPRGITADDIAAHEANLRDRLQARREVACTHPAYALTNVRIPGRETTLAACRCGQVQASPATPFREPTAEEFRQIVDFTAGPVVVAVGRTPRDLTLVTGHAPPAAVARDAWRHSFGLLAGVAREVVGAASIRPDDVDDKPFAVVPAALVERLRNASEGLPPDLLEQHQARRELLALVEQLERDFAEIEKGEGDGFAGNAGNFLGAVGAYLRAEEGGS